MPSLLAKLGVSSKPNPYMNPHHLGHMGQHSQNLPATTTTTTTTTKSTASAPAAPAAGHYGPDPQLRNDASSCTRSALPPSYSSDFLVEARSAAGRDAVTGRQLHSPNTNTANTANTQSQASLADELRQVEEEERTMYQNRSLAADRHQTMGSKYELFAKEMRKRREQEMRLRVARGGLEYYAPERTLEEYYHAAPR